MNSYYRIPQQGLNFSGELIIDNFAGGGGASTGIEAALGRPVDIAINHDPEAVRMHEVNHPQTQHFCESVWDVKPLEACKGQPVGLAWFSPDCKHFSKAKGSTPVNKNIRGLAWVVLRWAATVRPRVIMLENVEEFKKWGPLVTGEDGELRPCKANQGRTFNSFKNALKRHGYQVEHKELRACDYGTPTIRKRLFLIARCDDQPINWPAPTHGDPTSTAAKTRQLKPWVPASKIIDWSLPCPSIFERKRPLAENTMRRIARGIQRFVIDNPKPFIVRIGQQGHGKDGMQYELKKPLTTITTKAEHLLIAPYIQPYYGDKAPIARGRELTQPIGTQTTENRFSLCTAFLAKHFGGVTGTTLDKPWPTITAIPCQNQIVTSHLLKLRNGQFGQSVTDPIPTLTAGGTHVGEVRALLVQYYGTSHEASLTKPLPTITTRDRFGLVMIRGEAYEIVDIGMRMLQPHELYAAQGFPKDYVFTHDSKGKKITKTQQVAKCGNSVCPKLAQALVAVNVTISLTIGEVAA